MITIITDSTSDLGADLAKQYHIQTLPLTVHIHNKEFADGVDIDLRQLYSLVGKYGELPKTSALSFAEYCEAFRQEGEIIYIGLSSMLSSCMQNAFLAAQSTGLSRIHVIDSKNLSTGIGLLVLKAAEMRDAGASSAEIIAEIQSRVPRIRTSFVVDTLEYIYKGGRCSAVQNIVGSLLSIRPVIEVKSDGTMDIAAKIRGSRKKALTYLLDQFSANIDQIELHRVFVTHSGCDDDAVMLADELRRRANIDEVLITTAGSVVASHCGPNTIGILYTLK